MASMNAQTHFRVNGAVGFTDDRTPWALLGVDLKEVECPEQMLWVPTPWSKLITDDELPDELDDSFACSEELAKEPGLHGQWRTSARLVMTGGS